MAVEQQKYVNSRIEGYLAEIRELNSKNLVEINALYETVKTGRYSLNMEDMLSSIFNNATSALEAESGSLMLFDPEEKILTIEKAHGLDEDVIRNTRIELGEGIAGLVAQSGEPLIIHREADSLQVKGRKKYREVNSICVPLKTKNGIIGIINLNRNADDGQFKENHLKLLSTMANEAASVIENANRYRDAHEGYLSIIQTLASIVEMRDPYTASHQKQVANLVHALATEMGLSKREIDGVHMAASIHDIGKISVPAEILSKPSRLNKNEFDMIKEHPQVGYNMLKGIAFPWPVAQIVLQHHERLDGSGYPQKLSGEEIVLEARVLGVADVVEAMASHRPYRPALGIDKALEEISKNRGVLYDIKVVNVCLKLFYKKGWFFSQNIWYR
jgi:putative nucleotidyltransferase with HDIG domain